ncbi:MAG: hypothetical protein AAF065_11515 [Verrucomicrobiota bacterium]
MMMLFLGYGALLARSMIGSGDVDVKKLGSITSGIGLLLMLVAGFALISKIGYSFATPWILVKLVIWIALGGLIALINRKPDYAKRFWWILIGLGFVAASMVYVRPF